MLTVNTQRFLTNEFSEKRFLKESQIRWMTLDPINSVMHHFNV